MVVGRNQQEDRPLRSAALALLVILCLSGAVLAQGAPSATPVVPGNTVPAWVFYWVLGLSTVIGGGLLLVIRTLWERGNRVSGLSEEERGQLKGLAEKKSCLTESERGQLKQLHEWHGKVDDDQVPLWYTPRSWVELIKNTKQDHAAITSLLKRVVEHGDSVNDDLRQQLKERLALHDQQQTKMLKLAVRVQQAVEALAGLEPPSIEPDLGDDGDEG